ncbi:MAG: deoxyhypusine synthase family protein [Candidatus Nanoarchaeia archaeon]|nr:deoxyhypusine synthase family protein [Candidatus Nanoarchaeia archaeon]MDD5238883.1 deoxyhypusine synthase family protein [Candidatus Nanoarchaeia archaeon]
MKDAEPIRPLSIPNNIVELVENVYAKSSYQGRKLAQAAKLWPEAVKSGQTVWLGFSGALTPTGLGGIMSELIKMGYIDIITMTGANAYHDLHFAYSLPVRKGSPDVDDDDLYKDGTTRIYDTNIHNRITLKGQDTLLQDLLRKVLPKMPQKYSSAMLLNGLGKQLDKDERAVSKKGSVLYTAAKKSVPIYLDSQSNHSLGMDLALLATEGYNADMCPTQDIMEAAAYSINIQPQFNVFLGEGGPRNFTQTTGPTASEIFYIPFDGSSGGIILSVSDERTGALSGSTFKEAVSWGKYTSACLDNKVSVWGEYTITFPLIAAYIKAKGGVQKPKRLMDKREEFLADFLDKARKNKHNRIVDQKKLRKEILLVQKAELERLNR